MCFSSDGRSNGRYLRIDILNSQVDPLHESPPVCFRALSLFLCSLFSSCLLSILDMASFLVVRNLIEKRTELASDTDLSIIAITWGFTLGFGFLTTWTAIKQTRHMWKRRNGHLNHPVRQLSIIASWVDRTFRSV